MRLNHLLIASAVVMAAFGTSALAGLGDSLEQCKKKYGEAVATARNDQMFDFTKNGVSINIRLRQGKVAAISYAPAGTAKLTMDQIKSFLLANRGKGDWEIPGMDHETGTMTWTHEDGDRGATIDKDYRLLNFYLIDPTKTEKAKD